MNESLKSCRPQHEEKTMCAVEPETLNRKCEGLLSLAQSNEFVAHSLYSNLFGPASVEGVDAKEPHSVDEALSILKNFLESTYKTLSVIQSKI